VGRIGSGVRVSASFQKNSPSYYVYGSKKGRYVLRGMSGRGLGVDLLSYSCYCSCQKWVNVCGRCLDCVTAESGYPPPWNIPRTFAPPGQFHRPLHGVGHFPFHHHRLSIYNMKRSNVKVYEIHSGDRLGSGVRVSASFQIVALTAGGTP